MSVEFNELNYKPQNSGGEKTTATGRLLMKISGGTIKNQQQANKVMLVLTIAIFALSLYFFIKGI